MKNVTPDEGFVNKQLDKVGRKNPGKSREMIKDRKSVV